MNAIEEAVHAERQRIAGILNLESFEGREDLAFTLIEKGASVEDAREYLEASPAAVKEAISETVKGAAQTRVLAQMAADCADVAPDAGEPGAQVYTGANPQFATAHSAIKAIKAAKYGVRT